MAVGGNHNRIQSLERQLVAGFQSCTFPFAQGLVGVPDEDDRESRDDRDESSTASLHNQSTVAPAGRVSNPRAYRLPGAGWTLFFVWQLESMR